VAVTATPVVRNLLRGAAAGTMAAVVSRLAGLVVVPIALHGLGAQLYGTWVVSGVIASSQGLFDFGAMQTVARYIAIAQSVGDRGNVRRVLLLSTGVYVVLSVIVLAVILPLSGEISDLLGVAPASRHGADVLLWSGALAFAVSNASGLLIGVLTGLNRAHTAYVAVAAGYVAYLAVVALGSATGHVVGGIAASGPALFATQVALMLPRSVSGLRAIPASVFRPLVRLRDLLGYSLGMQSASIADFAALSLPRIAAALMLGAGAVAPLDITLRAGALIAGVIGMTQVAVLPVLATTWGRDALHVYKRLARELFAAVTFGSVVLMLLSIACLGPAIRLWVGSRYGDAELLALAVTAALLTHGATAPLTAAAQARGRLRRVVALKFGILVGLLALIPALGSRGADGLGAALSAAMLGPSVLYCLGELRGALRLRGPAISRLGDYAPFVAATAVPVGLRLGFHPPDAMLVAISAMTFGAALAWAVRCPPLAIRWMLLRRSAVTLETRTGTA